MKKLLVIPTAIAMLSLSGAAYAGNKSTQVQVGTFLTAQQNVQVGFANKSTQVQVLSALSSQFSAQGGAFNRSTQVQFGTVGSSQTSIQVGF
jgi:hypothetical protein